MPIGVGVPHGASAVAQPVRQLVWNFDQATVQRLLDHVTEERNATVLKYSYFSPHRRPPLPVEQGFELLKSALDKERVGSQRWFTLQSIVAFASLQSNKGVKEDGYKAYGEIFNHWSEAPQGHAVDALQDTIYEYVTTLVSYHGDGGAEEASKGDLLELALKACLSLPAITESRLVEVPWAVAIRANGNTQRLTDIIEKALANPATPKSYLMLRTAAAVCQLSNPGRALEFLTQAKHLLPTTDKKQVASFYETLVTVLIQNKQWDAAIASQQEYLRLTDEGRGRLAQLQVNHEDEAGLETTLKALDQPGVAESEVNDVALILLSLGKLNAPDKAAQLLQHYLTTPHKRDIEQELRARVMLGQYLIARGKVAEAQVALVVGPIPQPLPTPLAQRYYDAAQQMRNGLK